MNQLILLIDQLSKDCYKNSKAHGFWDEPRNKPEMFMLMVSEVSEALEYVRHGDGPSDHIPFTGVEEEMADVLVRVFDFCGGFNLRLGEALLAKMEFNKTRPHKHEKVL